MESLMNEIVKIFRKDLVHDSKRVEIKRNDNEIIVTIYENENRKSNGDTKSLEEEKDKKLEELKIEFPNSIKILPLIVDKQQYYALLHGCNNCECALLIKDDKKHFLILIEMKTKLYKRDLKKIFDKAKYSLYLSLILIKTLEIQLDGYYFIVAYYENKLPISTQATDIEMSFMSRDSKERKLLKKWQSSKLEFDWIYNSKIIVYKKEFDKDFINWNEINNY